MTEDITMSKIIDEVKNTSEDDLKKIIEEHFETVRTQGMKIGATYLAAAISGVIEKNLKKGKDSSLRDYQRAIKRIMEIVSVQLKRDETQQNDLKESNDVIEEPNDNGES
jgi:hypothetical protein